MQRKRIIHFVLILICSLQTSLAYPSSTDNSLINFIQMMLKILTNGPQSPSSCESTSESMPKNAVPSFPFLNNVPIARAPALINNIPVTQVPLTQVPEVNPIPLTSNRPFLGEGNLEMTGNFPQVDCNQIGVRGNLCLPHPIIIDPGHNDSSLSKRNSVKGSNKFFNEGKMNMATSLILKDIIKRCLNHNKDKPQVKLTRWPGQTRFAGDGALIGATLTNARINYINNYLVGNSNNALVVSMHFNAFKPKDIGMVGRAEVFIDGRDEGGIDQILAENMASHIGNKLGVSGVAKVDTTENDEDGLSALGRDLGMVSSVNPKGENVLVEGFFMNGSRGLEVAKKMLNPGQYHEFWMEDNQGAVDPKYRVTREHIDVALGVAQGLVDTYSCN